MYCQMSSEINQSLEYILTVMYTWHVSFVQSVQIIDRKNKTMKSFSLLRLIIESNKYFKLIESYLRT